MSLERQIPMPGGFRPSLPCRAARRRQAILPRPLAVLPAAVAPDAARQHA